MFKIGSKYYTRSKRNTRSKDVDHTLLASRKSRHIFKDVTPNNESKLIDAIDTKNCTICTLEIGDDDRIVHHCFTPAHAKCVAKSNYDICFLNCGEKLVYSSKTVKEIKESSKRHECRRKHCYASISDKQMPCPYPFETEITLKSYQFFFTEFKDRIIPFLRDKFSVAGYKNIEIEYVDRPSRSFTEDQPRSKKLKQQLRKQPAIYISADHEMLKNVKLYYSETDLIRGNQDRNTTNMMMNLMSDLRTDLMISTLEHQYPGFFDTQSELYIYHYLEHEDRLILNARGTKVVLKLSRFWDVKNLNFSFEKLQKVLSEKGLSISKLATKRKRKSGFPHDEHNRGYNVVTDNVSSNDSDTDDSYINAILSTRALDMEAIF